MTSGAGVSTGSAAGSVSEPQTVEDEPALCPLVSAGRPPPSEREPEDDVEDRAGHVARDEDEDTDTDDGPERVTGDGAEDAQADDVGSVQNHSTATA